MPRNNFDKGSGFKSFLFALLGAVVGGLLVFFLVVPNFKSNGSDSSSGSSTESTSQSDGSSKNTTITRTDEDLSMESKVVKKSIDSVVGVTTKTATQYDSIFGTQTGYQEGVGSGSIVTSDGYILTNSHVVSDGDAEEINVLLNDGKTLPAKLVWNDTTLDLAVIKVDANDLPAIEFGDSDQVIVGDRVVAIGNPLGLELQSTVTSGIISGLNRSVSFETGATMDGLMQTDAAINAGNSGGPLLNTNGQLIGINTAKAGNSDGIGFAIPANLAKKVVDQIAKTGKFTSVYLGITGVDLSLVAQSYDVDTDKLGTDKGIIVQSVYDDNLDTIEKGDIITKIDDKEVDDMSSLKKVLLNYSVGDNVEITLYRDGKEKKVNFEFTLDSSNVDALKGANPEDSTNGDSNSNNSNNGNNSNSGDNSQNDNSSGLPSWLLP